jgi:hypothetical protein
VNALTPEPKTANRRASARGLRETVEKLHRRNLTLGDKKALSLSDDAGCGNHEAWSLSDDPGERPTAGE